VPDPGEPQPTVAAVIAGRAGASELEACRAAVAAQTVAPAEIVADRAERFEDGMQAAHARGARWIWLLHADGVPDPTALEELLAATTAVPEYPTPALVTAKPVRPDGTLADDLLPRPDYNRVERSMAAYEHGVQAIRWADFTCALVNRETIDEHGVSDSELSPHAAELEYTARVLRQGVGYLAPRSVVRTSAPGGHGDQAVGAYVGDTVRLLRSRSWKVGESVGLGVGRSFGALRLVGRR